jgi:hypothetical protein
MLLEELLSMVPGDTEERVERTRSRTNQQIRDALRHEMALRLNRRGGDEKAGSSIAAGVKVSVLPGLPLPLQKRELPPDTWLASQLATWQHSLRQLHQSSGDCQKLVAILSTDRRGAAVVAGAGQHLEAVHRLADTLLREAAKFNLVKWILEVEEDVLGAYFYQTRSLFDASVDARIELYWGVIGLVAMALGVTIEDLTVAVLAHELAHAYSHLGYDIDGQQWASGSFAKSDKGLKEGLAQYYGFAACNRLARIAPGSSTAFDELLKRQPSAYQTQKPWLEKATLEEVRLAMIETRRKQIGRLSEFTASLSDAAKKLRK